MSFAVPTEFPTSTAGNYEPVPADNHPGLCVGVIDLGTHMESYQGSPPKPVRKLKLQFELPGVVRKDGGTGIIAAKYNYSMHEKANFRKMLDNWLGAGWTEKFKGQSWEFLLGQPAMVTVQQGPAKSDPKRIVSWVSAVSKYPKGFPPPDGSRDQFWLDLSAKHLPEKLSLWDAEMVRQSREYLAGGFRDEAPRPDGQRGAAPPPPPAAPPSTAEFDEFGPAPPDYAAAPIDLVPLLVRYKVQWPYTVAELAESRGRIAPDDFARLDQYSVPF